MKGITNAYKILVRKHPEKWHSKDRKDYRIILS
jgi:hypothetical protein